MVKGIGRWTAEMFLMFNLGRPDVMPADDLGVQNAIRRHYRMRQRPNRKRLLKHAERWRPYRTAAAWYLWRSLDIVLPDGAAKPATKKSRRGRSSTPHKGVARSSYCGSFRDFGRSGFMYRWLGARDVNVLSGSKGLGSSRLPTRILTKSRPEPNRGDPQSPQKFRVVVRPLSADEVEVLRLPLGPV